MFTGRTGIGMWRRGKDCRRDFGEVGGALPPEDDAFVGGIGLGGVVAAVVDGHGDEACAGERGAEPCKL